MIRRSRMLRVIAAAPRIAVTTLTSPHTRYVPAPIHRHRVN